MYLIDRAKNGLDRLLQKSNRKTLSPDEFNSAFEYVQNKIVRESFNYMDSIKNMKSFGRSSKIDYDKLNLCKEYVRALSADESLTYDSITETFSFPDDYMFVEAIEYGGRVVEELSPREFAILANVESAPTEVHPIYIEHSDNIEIIPSTIDSGVTMYYYKEITAPNWTYNVINNVAVFNPAAGDFVDTILPDIAYDEIMNGLAEYAGVVLRQPDVVQVFDKTQNESEQLKRS